MVPCISQATTYEVGRDRFFFEVDGSKEEWVNWKVIDIHAVQFVVACFSMMWRSPQSDVTQGSSGTAESELLLVVDQRLPMSFFIFGPPPRHCATH